MKKKTLALALASVIGAPAAFADVDVGPFTIYGKLISAVETVSVDNVNATIAKTKDSQTRLADQTSRIGFKAKYDLGGGLYALGQVESRLFLGNNGDNTDDKAELGTRNTFVGLGSNAFGVVRLGRYDNAYKLSLNQSVPSIFNTTGTLNDAATDYGAKQILNRLGARQGDMVAWESPNWGGFQANVSYNMGKDSTGAISGGSASNTASFTPATDLMPQAAFGIAYIKDGLNIGFGYTTINNASWNLAASSGAKAANINGSQKLNAMQFGAEYKFGQFSLGAVAERTESSQSGTTTAAAFDQQQTTYGLIGTYKDGPWETQVHYAKANSVEGTAVTDTGATQAAVVVGYQLHKYVKLVGSFTRVNNDKNANFTSLSGFALDKGNSMNQLALGVLVAF
jgi:predicted porin